MDTNQRKVQHLLWRSGFGPASADIPRIINSYPEEYYKFIKQPSMQKPQYISVADEELISLYDSPGENKRAQLGEAERKKLTRLQREAVKRLNLAWMREMINGQDQLREKMAFFWHGHFASRNQNIFFNQLLLHTFREYALSDFGTLLKEVSKSAAMLNFLNNQQNKKGHPNENFARELMELFTLGRGNYTEHDIKEVARAFTGWTADKKGNFIFRKNQHDNGIKNIFGKTGNFTGDDVLNIILEKKQTASFIVTKIYKSFVRETANESIVAELAADFYNSNYSITKLLDKIFTAGWFYEEKIIGNKIKSPVELLVGMQRLIPLDFKKEQVLISLQKILGQELLYPPNVAGWPGGKTWIDSSTLLMRLRIPQMLYGSDIMNVKPKDNDDVDMGRGEENIVNLKNKTNIARINASADWGAYVKNFTNIPQNRVIPSLHSLLLQTTNAETAHTSNDHPPFASIDSLIKTTTLQLMSTPEYQLC